MTSPPAVVHNAASQRFETSIEGQTAYSKYLRVGSRIVIEHTEVPVNLEGQGVASRIVRAALEFARREQLTVVPLCPFTAAFVRRHPEFQDLVEEGYRY
jgi:predicted GNAT family acetyltransferase